MNAARELKRTLDRAAKVLLEAKARILELEAREAALRALDAEELARVFHEAYEAQASLFGYEAREDSAVAWENVPEPNKSLMIATAARVLEHIEALGAGAKVVGYNPLAAVPSPVVSGGPL